MKRFFRCAVALLLLVCLLGITPRAKALNRYLRVGLNPNTPPFQFQQADGTCAGMHVDMLTAIAEADNFEIEFVPFETDKACLEALRDGEIDLVLGEIATKANSTGDFCVTDSLTSSQLCVIVANDMLQSGKSARTAICVSDTIQHTLLANLGFHQFISVSNQIQLYQRHKELPGSAMIGVKDSLIYQLAQDGADKNYTVQYNYLGALEFTMVLRSADKELLRTMNTSINRFKATAQYENICSRWLPVSTREARFQRLFRIICVCAAFSALAVVGYVIVTRRIQQVLHRQVAEQTEQIRSANQTLERQYAQLQTESDLRNRIIKYSPSGMMLIDLDGTVTLMNKSACAIAGVRQPLLGKRASDIPVFRDILEREGQRLFTSGTMVDRSILRLGDSPLHTRAYSYMTHQIIRDKAVTGVLVTVIDVTEAEQERQEEFERQKSSALTRIAAGIAHEIRNPLMTIRTFASLIGTKGDSKQVQESFARYVPDEVDRINRLIDNLIHYAKPTNRHPKRVSVEELVNDSLSLIRPLLRKSNFRLDQKLESDLFILADRDQLKQVLVNIFLNSVEAMEHKCAVSPPSEPLTLRVHAANRCEKVFLTIRDEGEGMTEQELSACRDPFFTTKQTGAGLGLPLCEQYIRENSGVMEIESVKNEYTLISLIFERSQPCFHES